MQVDEFTLPVFYLRQIANQIEGAGADVGRWLAQSGLREAQLEDAALNVPFSVFRQLVLDALAITQEPALGLLLGERLPVNTHGMLGYAAMNSGTLRQALELFERFMPLRTSLLSMNHEIHGSEVRVVFGEPRPLGDIRGTVLEAVMLTVKNALDYISLGTCGISRVAFPFAEPEHAALARDLFRCEVGFGQTWAGFALPLDAIDLPLKLADSATFQEAALICQRELEKLASRESASTRVRRIMLEKQNGFPSLNVTARLLHMTPRTLHRRLIDEGTSFKEILEDVRHMLAVEHLRSGHLTIQEIAYTLGYTDLANFRRAFKRWEGVPPSGCRAGTSGRPKPEAPAYGAEGRLGA